MIQLESVTKRFPGGQEALSNLSLSVDKGEMVFVTGHSGAGKSTLLRLIALIERPTSGQVIVDGQNTRRVKRRKIPKYRRQIGMVFQDHKLLHDRPVFDNVALPLVIAGVGHRDAGRRVRAALDQVGLLHKERQQPETLSAGEQQRVGIARAIVRAPRARNPPPLPRSRPAPPSWSIPSRLPQSGAPIPSLPPTRNFTLASPATFMA